MIAPLLTRTEGTGRRHEVNLREVNERDSLSGTFGLWLAYAPYPFSPMADGVLVR